MNKKLKCNRYKNMGFLKNLIKHIKGSELVEKIIMVAFSVAMGAAVIAYTVGVINTNKDLQYAGSATFIMSTDGDFGSGNVASKNDISCALTNGAFSKKADYIGMNIGGKIDISSQKERLNKITFVIEENEYTPDSYTCITSSTGTFTNLVWEPDSTVYSVQFTKPTGLTGNAAKQLKLKEIHVECATSELNFINYDVSSTTITTSGDAGFTTDNLTKTEDGVTVIFPEGSYVDPSHIRVYQNKNVIVSCVKPIKEIRIAAQSNSNSVFNFSVSVVVI